LNRSTTCTEAAWIRLGRIATCGLPKPPHSHPGRWLLLRAHAQTVPLRSDMSPVRIMSAAPTGHSTATVGAVFAQCLHDVDGLPPRRAAD
jgi:hypothetical protein